MATILERIPRYGKQYTGGGANFLDWIHRPCMAQDAPTISQQLLSEVGRSRKDLAYSQAAYVTKLGLLQ